MYFQGEGLISNKELLKKVAEMSSEWEIIRDNKRREYYNIPAAFDIEVSSFYENNEKRSLMYVWQFGIYNMVTIGRTWKSFIQFVTLLKKILGLSETRRLLVYIHNLAYEFQFIRKRFSWEEVFILSERKPVYAHADGLEFRCSLKLAGGKPLVQVGRDLKKYPVQKAIGNLDYDKIRTPITPLSSKELLYCENDIRVLLSYIQEKIEQDGDITKIPLTNTGYVRAYCRKECFKRWKPYHQLMQQLTLDSAEYKQLKRAFQGGFTHANAHYVNMLLHGVGSHDFASSYPAVMVLEKFPMSRSVVIKDMINEDSLMELLLSKCCIMDIELFDLFPKRYNEHPLSKYKCYICENYVVDNGRIVMASHIGTTITEQDFFILREFYEWDKMEVHNLRVYEKAYLPTKFVEAILKLYLDKTQLKGIKGQEINYMISKGMINSGYGMMVTDPIRDELKYIDNEFHKIPKNVSEGIDIYNDNIRRFLFYPWGVWVTAYARANLFSGIIELGDDYVYADTDSVKSLHTESHFEYFSNYNKQIMMKIEKSANHHGINPALYYPKTKSGKVKVIGVWDYEGEYESFKTLGAKRYLTFRHETSEFDDIVPVQLTEPVYLITLAGSNKAKTTQYLRKTGDPFNNFADGLTIPKESSGRLILTYIDFETSGTVVDYLGVSYNYHELSSIHMERTEYNLSMSEEFIRYIEGITDISE